MGNKIAKIDAEAMNNLYGSEFTRLSGREVRQGRRLEGREGALTGRQAFEDHAGLWATLKKRDGQRMASSSFDENDPVKD